MRLNIILSGNYPSLKRHFDDVFSALLLGKLTLMRKLPKFFFDLFLNYRLSLRAKLEKLEYPCLHLKKKPLKYAERNNDAVCVILFHKQNNILMTV